VKFSVMPSFQHYVSGIPEPFCRCRPAVAGVRNSVSVAVSCTSNGIGWIDYERQAETVAVVGLASTEEIQATQTSILDKANMLQQV